MKKGIEVYEAVFYGPEDLMSRDPENETTLAKVSTDGQKVKVDSASEPEVGAIVGSVGGGIAGLTLGATVGPIGAVAGAALGAVAGALAAGAAKDTEGLHDEAGESDLRPDLSQSALQTPDSVPANGIPSEETVAPREGFLSVVKENPSPQEVRRSSNLSKTQGHDQPLMEDQDPMRQHPYEPKAPHSPQEPPLENPVMVDRDR